MSSASEETPTPPQEFGPGDTAGSKFKKKVMQAETAVTQTFEEFLATRAKNMETVKPDMTATVEDERLGTVKCTEHVKFLVEKDRREACPQRTPAWYAKRQNHVTASLMATICGENKYDRPIQAFLKKTGQGKPFTGNAATEHGNKYEPVALQKYEEATGRKCLDFGLLESLNEGESFLAGSPDGITTCGGLLEIKCPLRRVPLDEVPEVYVSQLQFLMHTLRLPWADFVQYIPGGYQVVEKLIITRVEYSPKYWYTRFPELVLFWEDVLDERELMKVSALVAGGSYEWDAKKYDLLKQALETKRTAKALPRPAPDSDSDEDEDQKVFTFSRPTLVSWKARMDLQDAIRAAKASARTKKKRPYAPGGFMPGSAKKCLFGPDSVSRGTAGVGEWKPDAGLMDRAAARVKKLEAERSAEWEARGDASSPLEKISDTCMF